MKKQIGLLLKVFVTLSPMIAGLILWNDLPDLLPRHFSLSGSPDGFSEKWIVVCLIPALLSVLTIGTSVLMQRNSPNRQLPSALTSILMWVVPIASVLIGSLSYMSALNTEIPVSLIVLTLVSTLFVIMGNYMPKCKPNGLVGFRLPWTRNNETVWRLTHHMAGWCMVIGGLVALVCSICSFEIGSLVALCAALVLPLAYSISCAVRQKSLN